MQEKKPVRSSTLVSYTQAEGMRQIIQQLRESEQRFRVMFEQFAIGIAFVAMDGRWLQVNQKLCDIVGYTREELLTCTFQDITYPEDHASDQQYIERLFANELQTHTLEKRYIRKDGSLVWINLTASLVRTSSGEPDYFVTFIEDISERKRAEEERAHFLEQAQLARIEAAARANELQSVLEAMADAVLVYDREGNIRFASAAAQELFPLDVWPEHATQSVDERENHYVLRDEQGQPIQKEQGPVSRLLRGEVLKGANVAEYQVRGRSGQDVWLSISGSPIHDAQGKSTGAVVVARDVTQRRSLERRTQRALEGLLVMAEALVQIPEIDVEADLTGQKLAQLTCSVLDCQRVGLLVLESDTHILRPLAVVGLSPHQEQEWWEQMQLNSPTFGSGIPPEIVERLRNKEVVVIDMSQMPYGEQPNPYHVQTMVIAPMFLADRLLGFVTLDYGEVRHEYTQDELVLSGAVGKFAALVVERQRLLHERAEAQGRVVALREANRRMEEFIGVASHELRTPLTTIKANIQLAMRRLRALLQHSGPSMEDVTSKLDAAHGMLERAERQVGVLNRLVNDLIDISRIQMGKLQLHLRHEPFNLINLVYEAVQEQRKVTPNRRIDLTLPEVEAILVIADPDRIVQVLTNYLSNALKYSESDKPVEVSLTLERERSKTPVGTEDTSIARVCVRDYGIGLSAEEQQHIWECFYQSPQSRVLSGSGVGLGLGLHISQTLIERHGGRVGVESIPDEGSTFWFTLPLAAAVSTIEQDAPMQEEV